MWDPVARRRVRRPPPQIAGYDFQPLLARVCKSANVIGYTYPHGIASRRWQLTILDITIDVDFDGAGQRIIGREWRVHGKNVWDSAELYRFKVHEFKGDLRACVRDLTALRICL